MINQAIVRPFRFLFDRCYLVVITIFCYYYYFNLTIDKLFRKAADDSEAVLFPVITGDGGGGSGHSFVAVVTTDVPMIFIL